MAPADELFSLAPGVVRRWRGLPAPIRAYLESFLSDAPLTDAACPARVVPLDAAMVADDYANDLRHGGPRLRAALPELARRVVQLHGKNPLVVRITATGVHDGTFFDMLLPSHRRVQFDELHRLHLVDGAAVEDFVAVDMATILRQLAAPSGRPF